MHESGIALVSSFLDRGDVDADIAAGITWSLDAHGDVVARRRDGHVVRSVDDLRSAGAGLTWTPSRVTSVPLTSRERDVADRVASGQTTQAIAEALGVSERTVTALRRSVRLKRESAATGASRSDEVGVFGHAGVWRDVVVEVLAAHDVKASIVDRPDEARPAAVVLAGSVVELTPSGTGRWVLLGDPPAGSTMVDLVRRGVVAVVGLADPPEVLLDAVSVAVQGRHRLRAVDLDRLVDEVRSGATLPPLTAREEDVLEGIGRGESVKQTARRLGISAKTAEVHRAALFRKLGVASAAEAQRVAVASSLLR